MRESQSSGPGIDHGERSAASVLASARTLAAGALVGGLVHEVANLLTVVDGLRQMERLGQPAKAGAERQALLDRPAERCSRLIEAFRSLLVEWPGGEDEAAGGGGELAAMRVLLESRLRGRSTRVLVGADPEAAAARAVRADVQRVALLLAVLALLEHARDGRPYPRTIELCRVRGGFSAHLAACRAAGDEEGAFASSSRAMLEAASALVRAGGGSLTLERSGPEGVDLTVTVQSGGA